MQTREVVSMADITVNKANEEIHEYYDVPIKFVQAVETMLYCCADDDPDIIDRIYEEE